MTIDLVILLNMLFAAFFGTLIYTVIGIIPGTDETAVLGPLTIILFALGVEPIVVLTFFVAAMVTLNTTASIPTALTGIPGGVMSTPFIPASNYLKEEGLTSQSMRKMTMGSAIGSLVAIPIVLTMWLFIYLLSKFTGFDILKAVQEFIANPKNIGIIFLVGAILLSLLAKKKIVSLIAILPVALIIGFIQKKTGIVGTPFFLSITSGPLLYGLVLLFIPKLYKSSLVKGNKEVLIEEVVASEGTKKEQVFSVFKILNKNETKLSLFGSLLASVTFFLSPVGMTLLIGESLTNNIEDKKEKAFAEVTVMNALKNATYLVGIMISLLILKFPISPAAMGPGGGFFENGSLVVEFPFLSALIAIVLAVLVSLVITGFLSLKYATKMTKVVFKYIPQEAVVALLLSLIVLLVFLNAGFVGVLVILAFSIFSGFINKQGVPFGVQFMILYAAPFLYNLVVGLF